MHTHIHTHTCTHTFSDSPLQFPLNADDYEEVLVEINIIADKHRQSLPNPLPASQLDELDHTNKIDPCCNQATKCVCHDDEYAINMAATALGTIQAK